MQNWTFKADGPYDWRTEGPLAYGYDAEAKGFTWDNAPLPPQRTLQRWLENDAEAFAIYWPKWYALAISGAWDQLYPAETMSQVSLNPPRVSGYTPSQADQTNVLKMADFNDNYSTPIDGDNDIPQWLKVIDRAARSVSDIVGGFTRAKTIEDRQAQAFSGNENHPLARGGQAPTNLTQNAIFWGVLLLTGLVVALILNARLK